MSDTKDDLIYVFGYTRNRRETGIKVDPSEVMRRVAEVGAQHEKTIVVLLKDGHQPVAYLMNSANQAVAS